MDLFSRRQDGEPGDSSLWVQIQNVVWNLDAYGNQGSDLGR